MDGWLVPLSCVGEIGPFFVHFGFEFIFNAGRDQLLKLLMGSNQDGSARVFIDAAYLQPDQSIFNEG